MAAKALTGWLWSSVRYASGMNLLVLFPIHWVYNATWLLFEGNWSSLPGWASYGLPAVEFALGLAIVWVWSHRSTQKGKP